MESNSQKKNLTESDVQKMFVYQATMNLSSGSSICHSAILECGYGSQEQVLNLRNSHGKYVGSSAQIDAKDGKRDKKIEFGYCKKLKCPCVPVPSDWYNGNEDDLMFDEETLDMEASVQMGEAFMVCAAKKEGVIAGGIITAKMDGQEIKFNIEDLKVAHVFYIDDFIREANWQIEELKKRGCEVTSHDLTLNDNVSDQEYVNQTARAWLFRDLWNGLDSSNKIDIVYIFTHGSERMLQFEDGSRYNAITLDGKNKAGDKYVASSFDSLEPKDITRLYIQACNVGHISYYHVHKENVASVLSMKVPQDSAVYGWNGSVSFGPPAISQKLDDFQGDQYDLAPRVSKDQDRFQELEQEMIEAKEITVAAGPLGQVTYRKGEYCPYGYVPETGIEEIQ